MTQPLEKSARTPAQPSPEAVQISLASSPRSREQVLLDGRLVLRTPYGLKPQDRLLLEVANAYPANHILSVAMPMIAPALALAALRPDTRVTFFHYDLFYIRQAESQAGGHRLQNFQTLCQSDIPALEEGAPDLMLAEFRIDGEAGLSLELLHQAHDRLAHGGKLLAVINNPRDKWLRHQLEKIFGNLTQVARDKYSMIYSVKRTDRPADGAGELSPQAHFVKHVEVNFIPWRLEFETRYGTFKSDGLDDGSRALLDVFTPGEDCKSILDLGCGWGGMGILAAKKAGAERLVMIDSNARAVEMATRNAERLGPPQTEIHLEADVESVESGALMGQFDAVVTNPPYGTDFRVLDMFITMAWRALRPGGQVWIVGKSNPHMVTKAEELFENVEVLRRRGYSVVKGVRQDTRKFE